MAFSNSQKIRLLIADDHVVVREGLKHVLENYADIEITGEANTGDEILAIVDTQEIDIILLDISMPGPGILEIIKLLQRKHPGIKILVLSVHSEDQYAIRVLRSGAKGYLEKSHSMEELYKAIRMVYRGHTYLTPRLTERIFNKPGLTTGKLLHELLSNRELQILLLIGAGETNNAIATTLSLSPKTISTYRARILEKMGLKNNSELIRYTMENELIQ